MTNDKHKRLCVSSPRVSIMRLGQENYLWAWWDRFVTCPTASATPIFHGTGYEPVLPLLRKLLALISLRVRKGLSHKTKALAYARATNTPTIFFAALLLCAFAFSLSPAAAQTGWKKIFDGKTLKGWQAPDMSYFTVEDGAITGTTTAQHNPPYNQFIVWQGGEVADFELKFKFRIFGAKSNSGMQFRSVVKDKGLVHGYQADMDGAGKYIGGIWDEYGTRRSLAGRGERAVIDESGKRTVTRFAESEALLKDLKTDQWNEYHITAIGSRVTLKINGQTTTELDDRETGKAASKGILAMPIIPGEPMKVQYKDIQLKNLSRH